MNLRERLEEIEQGVEYARQTIIPTTKAKRAEVVVFKSVQLMREMIEHIERLEQAHGWHLQGGSESGE